MAAARISFSAPGIELLEGQNPTTSHRARSLHVDDTSKRTFELAG